MYNSKFVTVVLGDVQETFKDEIVCNDNARSATLLGSVKTQYKH